MKVKLFWLLIKSFSLLILGIILGVLILKSLRPLYELFSNIACRIRGGRWSTCLEGWGPCGCFEIFKDGGKPCTSGSECLAGACIITGDDKPNAEGLYVGHCPYRTLYGKKGDKYPGFCGEAIIENGKIIKDLRSCIY